MHENHGPAGTDANEPLTLPGPASLPGTEPHEASASDPAAPQANAGNGTKWIRDASRALPSWDLRFKVAMVASFLILVTVLVVNRVRTNRAKADDKTKHAAVVTEIPKPTPPVSPKPQPKEIVFHTPEPEKPTPVPEPSHDEPPLPVAKTTTEKPAEEEIPPAPPSPVVAAVKEEPVPPDLSPPKTNEPVAKPLDEAPPAINEPPQKPEVAKVAEMAIEPEKPIETPKPVETVAPKEEPAPTPPPKEEPAPPPPAPLQETPPPAPPPASSGLNLTPTPTPPPATETPSATLYPIPFSGPKRLPDAEAVEPSAAAPSPPSETRHLPDASEPITHVVRRGENFFSISQRYYATGRWYLALWDANKDVAKTPEDLYVGTTIRIPAPEKLRRDLVSTSRAKSAKTAELTTIQPAADANSPRDALTSRASRRSESETLLSVGDPTSSRRKDAPSLPNAESPAVRTTKTYTVKKPNETLRSIASRELGDSDRDGEIQDLNREQLEEANGFLTVGMKLKLPVNATQR